jgi:outer membrane receptor for ferrienterochelin and colicins
LSRSVLAALIALFVVGLRPGLARAQEAPEVKAPEVKPPEKPKAPEVKPPALPGSEETKKKPAGKEEEQGVRGLPPEMTGEKIAPPSGPEEDLPTIQKLANRDIETASKRAESADTAPAGVIVVTAAEIEERGYVELSDLLDDLPSIDVIRPWGDTYFKTYWRGYRNAIGSPWLLLIDGIVYNQLWRNDTEIMASLPLANISKVEIVFGPASSVYGPNAAMGVINVITIKDYKRAGPHARTHLFVQAPQDGIFSDALRKGADLSIFFKGDDFRISVTGRLDFGVLDPALADRFEWTKEQYSSDRRLWGDFVDFETIAGGFRSPSEKQAVDARLFVGDTEIAAQMFRLHNGAGMLYAADRIQNRQLFTRTERGVYIRHRQEFSSKFHSTTLLRYRQSNIDTPSTQVERIEPQPPDTSYSMGPTGPMLEPQTVLDGSGASSSCVDVPAPCIRYQYWQSTNFAYTLQQDFNVDGGKDFFITDDLLLFDFGLQYERRDLERAYVRSGGDWDPARPFDSDPPYRFPQPLEAEENVHNRNQLDVVGGYFQAKYLLPENLHSFTVGLRLDYNAFLEEIQPTFRGGYVGHFFDVFRLKVLYGQAVQEPTWRELFGAWNGTGSNPGLSSERSQTLELRLGYVLDWLFVEGSVYAVDYLGAILSTGSSGQNVGKRLVIGADLGATALIPLPGLRQLRLWGYYSPYFYAKQTPVGGTEDDPSVDIGDLAAHKLMVGGTIDVSHVFSATLLARCIGPRSTVSSNPVGSVDGYCTADVNFLFRNLLNDRVFISARVTNILDSHYYHPGIREADSGSAPGKFIGDDWVGSAGYFNSLLPQPGRAFTLQAGLEI